MIGFFGEIAKSLQMSRNVYKCRAKYTNVAGFSVFSGRCFVRFGAVVGDGAFFPAPFDGCLGGGGGGAVGRRAKGRFEGAGWA